MTEGKKWRSENISFLNNNNRKQKITLSSNERVSYICDFYGYDSWYSMTEGKTEKCKYLTYNNNNRKQKKNTFIWRMYFCCWWLLWLCFIIFHDRRKNEEVLAYLTYSNNDRKQKKHFHLMNVIFLSAIVTAVHHHIPWQNEKLRIVNISYLQQ